MAYVFNAVGSPFKAPYHLNSFANMQALIRVAKSGGSKISLTACGPRALEAYKALMPEKRASVRERLAAVTSICDLVFVYLRDCKEADHTTGLSEAALIAHYDVNDENVAAGLRGLNQVCTSLGI